MMSLWMVAGTVLALVIAVAIHRLLSWLADLDATASELDSAHLQVAPGEQQGVSPPSIHDPASKSLSIVFPAYNEVDRLPQTLDETLAYLQSRRDRHGPAFSYELIIVDDGSRDATSQVGYGYSKKYGFDCVRVLKLPRNRGKGGAVKQGMLVARGLMCLMADADGATQIADVESLESALIEVATEKTLRHSEGSTAKRVESAAAPAPTQLAQLQNKHGMVVGSRAHLEEVAVSKRKWYRNVLMHGFHLLVMMVVGNRIRDTQCGFKLFTRRTARLLFSNLRLQRFCFDVELIYMAQQLGVPVKELPVHWTEMPGSKIKFTSIIHMAFELLAVKVAHSILRMWPVRTEAQLQGQHA